MEFCEGQRVHVEFDGIVRDPAVENADADWLVIQSDTGWHHKVWSDDVRNVVAPLTPANWPPQVGDIWETDGIEYVVRVNRANHSNYLIQRIDLGNGAFAYSLATLDRFKALNPRLIRRREV